MLMIGFVMHGVIRATTSQFRTPLTFLDRGSLSYPLPPVEDTWWFEKMDSGRPECTWTINNFKGVYGRTATQSFYDPCADPCKSNRVTGKTASLSNLFFGKEAFRGEEAFAGGALMTDPCQPALVAKENVYLGFSHITPRIEYNEYGAYFGLTAERSIGNGFHIGVRGNMPIKVIRVEHNQGCKLYETVDDVVKMREINEEDEETPIADFAARLDFLTSLNYQIDAGGPECESFVQYNIHEDDQGDVTALGMPGTAMVSANTPENAGVFVIGRPNRDLPNQPYRKTIEGNSIESLSANGVLGNNSIAFFQDGIDYKAGIGTDRSNQSGLFVVPSANDDEDRTLTETSRAVSVRLEHLLYQINALGVNSPVNFFKKSCDIDFCRSEQITAQGDISAEVYSGYVQDDWFVDGIFGMSLPTGKRTKHANRIFAQSTGNNGHVEVKLGADGGWKVCDWFAFELDAAYHYAFNRAEHRAVPYAGATVRNIGPEIMADVSWGYFTGHVNLNFFHPYNSELGGMVGYDLFAKQKDRVCIKCPAPTDCLGRDNSSLPENIQGVDSSILERNTNSVTHKLRCEMFHRWSFCEIFAGGAQVFAGKNAMKESEGYLGMKIYF